MCFSSAVAERVLAKGEVVLEGITLTISPGPMIDPYSVLVCGLTSEITQETLELYFESTRHSGGGTVESVMYKNGRKWACVTFKSKEGKILLFLFIISALLR